MKCDPCTNPTCGWLGIRPDGAPMPPRCPRCGSPVVTPPRVRTIDRLRAEVARRVLAVEGDAEAGTWS